MAEERQELTIHAGIEGAAEAASDLEQVDHAQEGVTEQFIAAKPAVEQLAEAKKKLGASGEAYTSILARIHPQLGAMADVMRKGSEIVGQLATQKLHLREVTEKVTAALRANWKALAFFASVGGVIAGIAAIAAAVRAMKQEWDDATAAIKRHRDELNEVKGAEQDRQKAIEAISDVRREGGMTAEQARRAAETAGRVSEQFPQLDEAAINQVAGLLGDRLSRDQMTAAAILQQQGRVQLGPEMTAETMTDNLARAMERYGENVERFMEREVAQRAEALQEATKQATATTGATLELKRLIEEKLGPGVDIEAITEDVQRFGTLEAIQAGEAGKRRFPFAYSGYEVPTPEAQGATGIFKTTMMTEQRIDEVMRVLQEISQALKRPHTTNINPRFTYPDARSRQDATVNGQTYRTRIGEG